MREGERQTGKQKVRLTLKDRQADSDRQTDRQTDRQGLQLPFESAIVPQFVLFSFVLIASFWYCNVPLLNFGFFTIWVL